MIRFTPSASGLAAVISGTLQSGSNSSALYERSGLITISQAIDAYIAALKIVTKAARSVWLDGKPKLVI